VVSGCSAIGIAFGATISDSCFVQELRDRLEQAPACFVALGQTLVVLQAASTSRRCGRHGIDGVSRRIRRAAIS